MSRQPPGIVARIRQMQRAARAESPGSSPSGAGAPIPGELEELRTRLAHLEQLVQGLQDSVHRASERQDRRMTDIERRLDPVALAAALSQDARERGL